MALVKEMTPIYHYLGELAAAGEADGARELCYLIYYDNPTRKPVRKLHGCKLGTLDLTRRGLVFCDRLHIDLVQQVYHFP